MADFHLVDQLLFWLFRVLEQLLSQRFQKSSFHAWVLNYGYFTNILHIFLTNGVDAVGFTFHDLKFKWIAMKTAELKPALVLISCGSHLDYMAPNVDQF